MILLPKSKYGEVLPYLHHVTINHYFAKSVLTNMTGGQVFVDCLNKPSSFYIVNHYGMALLFGKHNNKIFNQNLIKYFNDAGKERSHVEWVQAYPSSWNNVIEENALSICHEDVGNTSMRGRDVDDCIVKNTRVNFHFKPTKRLLERFKRVNKNIINTDANIFNALQGSVVPNRFWPNAETFLTLGKGFSLFDNDDVAATAYSAFVDDGILEIGIETDPAFRGKGYAFDVCCVLINYCLANQLTPVWACRLENLGSFRLAQKLGFVAREFIPYYRLARNACR